MGVQMDGGIGSCDFGHMSEINIREQIFSFPEHASFSLKAEIPEVPSTRKVCVFSFGYSTTAADILSAHADTYSDRHVPVIEDSRVPGWIDGSTVAIILSYDGTEKDILSLYDSLGRIGCHRICITSGGDLADMASRDSVSLVRLPHGMTARSCTGYMLGVLCSLIQSMGVCPAADRLREEIPAIEAYRDALLESNLPIEIASDLSDGIPAVYGTSDLRAAFRRWKMNVNEDLSRRAFYGELPEFDHNELVGWFDENPHAPELRVIVLKGRTGSDLLDFIVENMVDILNCEGRPVITVDLEGDDPLYKASCGVLLGEAVTSVMRRRCSP